MLDVHPSGYYAWYKQPQFKLTRAHQHLTGLIKHFRHESIGVCGYRKVLSDIQDVYEKCSINLFHRITRNEGLEHKWCITNHVIALVRLISLYLIDYSVNLMRLPTIKFEQAMTNIIKNILNLASGNSIATQSSRTGNLHISSF